MEHLRAQLAECPNDMETRAVYADWLEEAGELEMAETQREIIDLAARFPDCEYVGSGYWIRGNSTTKIFSTDMLTWDEHLF